MEIELINRIKQSYQFKITYKNKEYILNEDTNNQQYKLSLVSSEKNLKEKEYREIISQYLLET